MTTGPRILALYLATVASACAQPSPDAAELVGDTSAEQAILAQERQALARWSSGDPSGYAQHAADDVTYFDDIRATARIEGLAAWEAYLATLEGVVPPHAFEIVDPKVQVYGDIGILTLHYHPSAPDGTPQPRWKATSVYRLVDGEWRIVHAHWSTIETP